MTIAFVGDLHLIQLQTTYAQMEQSTMYLSSITLGFGWVGFFFFSELEGIIPKEMNKAIKKNKRKKTNKIKKKGKKLKKRRL